MKKIKWRNERRKVVDLIPADYNPRSLSDEEKKHLNDSVVEFGTVDPVIINTDNTMIGGHQRCKIYADLGIDEIDVRVPDRKLNKTEEKRLNLRLNKNTGSWDIDKLAQFDSEMLLDIGWSDDEIEMIFDKEIETEEDDFDINESIERAKKETRVETGDLYEMGNCRMLIGDSTIITDIERLMGGKKADCVYSDPPYNIGLSYSKGLGTDNKYQGTYDDKKTDNDYRDFIIQTISNITAYSKEDAHFFYWCDEKYIGMFQKMFEENLIENKRVCLWVKNNQNPTPQLAFNKVYEPCVYGTKGRPYLNENIRNLNEVLNKEVRSGNDLIDDIQDIFNIWLVDRENTQNYKHPTMKPITLHEKPIKRCTKVGDIVVDLFLGSGSTLMACQQLHRKCFGIEKDPVFGTVILDRWENATGLKAKKLK